MKQEKSLREKRPTHDASRPKFSNTPVNRLYYKSKLGSPIIAFCVFIVLHMIHALRVHHPNTTILLRKYDMDGAYGRIYSQSMEAKLCFTIIDRITFLLTRLPFGTTPEADCLYIDP